MARSSVKQVDNSHVLRDALSACRAAFMAVVVFSFCINLLMLTAPLYMLQLFNRVIASRSTDTLLFLTLIAAAALLTLSALEVHRSFILIRISSWLDRKISVPVLTESVTSALAKTSDISAQGLRDLSTLRTFLTGSAIFPILDAPWSPVFIGVVFVLHPILGFIALGGAVVILSLAVTNEVVTRKLLAGSGLASIKAMQQAEGVARKADVIEAMGMMPALAKRWETQNQETLSLQARASRRSATLAAASKFLRQLLQIGLLGTGAWLVIMGEITAGVMVAALFIMRRGLAPVDQAITSWKSVILARNAYRRTKERLSKTPARGEAMELPAPTGRLTVERLRYRYSGVPDSILRRVSFRLRPGEVLGIVGSTAAGKSTLGRLIVGNLRPNDGHVRLDGIDVSHWRPEKLGRFIGYLPQDPHLFSGTVQENIARMSNGSSEAVVAAARLAGVHEMIARLPRAYDTDIGEDGLALSGGQRQRIALARAVFGEPKLVVLDEADANLDHEGERALLRAIRKLKESGVTVIIIAHSASMIRHVDKIAVVRDGSVKICKPEDSSVLEIVGAEPPEITNSAAIRDRA